MNSPWASLEKVRGLSAVEAEWRRHTGADFDGFQTGFLQKTGRQARSYPCPHKIGCTHQVVPRGAGFVGVCKDDDGTGCDDLRLTVEDVEIWEVNRSRLGRAVAKSFECDARETDLHLPRTWQVGVKFSNAVPVVLTIQNGRDEFRNVVAELAARWRQPFILLAPTSRFVDGVCTELLEKSGAGFFDLESNVILTAQGNLQPLKPPGELFARFAPGAKEPAPEDVVRQLFGLIEKLDSENHLKSPSALKVFQLYCGRELTAEQVAVKCKCSKGTVVNRLEMIRQATKTEPEKLRAYSPHVQKLEESIADPRAKHIHRKNLIDAPDDDEDEQY